MFLFLARSCSGSVMDGWLAGWQRSKFFLQATLLVQKQAAKYGDWAGNLQQKFQINGTRWAISSIFFIPISRISRLASAQFQVESHYTIVEDKHKVERKPRAREGVEKRMKAHKKFRFYLLNVVLSFINSTQLASNRDYQSFPAGWLVRLRVLSLWRIFNMLSTNISLVESAFFLPFLPICPFSGS